MRDVLNGKKAVTDLVARYDAFTVPRKASTSVPQTFAKGMPWHVPVTAAIPGFGLLHETSDGRSIAYNWLEAAAFSLINPEDYALYVRDRQLSSDVYASVRYYRQKDQKCGSRTECLVSPFHCAHARCVLHYADLHCQELKAHLTRLFVKTRDFTVTTAQSEVWSSAIDGVFRSKDPDTYSATLLRRKLHRLHEHSKIESKGLVPLLYELQGYSVQDALLMEAREAIEGGTPVPTSERHVTGQRLFVSSGYSCSSQSLYFAALLEQD